MFCVLEQRKANDRNSRVCGDRLHEAVQLCGNQVTNYSERGSSWKVNRRSSAQEITRLYGTRNSLPRLRVTFRDIMNSVVYSILYRPSDRLLSTKLVPTFADRRCRVVSGTDPGYRFRGTGFDSRRYQIFWEVVYLRRGPLSLMSATEEILERKSSDSGLEIREYCKRDPSRWPRGTLYPLKLALTSQTSGGRSVGVVRSRTQATELYFSSRH
jgi:hypothetical protein